MPLNAISTCFLHISIHITTPGKRVTLTAGSLAIRASKISLWVSFHNSWFRGLIALLRWPSRIIAKLEKGLCYLRSMSVFFSGDTTIINKTKFFYLSQIIWISILDSQLNNSSVLGHSRDFQMPFQFRKYARLKKPLKVFWSKPQGPNSKFSNVVLFLVFFIYVISDVAVLKKS